MDDDLCFTDGSAIELEMQNMSMRTIVSAIPNFGFTHGESSVAMVVTDVFQINWFSVRNKIGKIAKIFGKIEDPKNRGVI